MIEKLKEKRSNMITQVFSRGLDSNVLMKDSGIDWLGEIPEHWSFGAIKYYVKSKPDAIKTGPFGSQLHSSDMESGEIKVYNQKNVIRQDLTIGDEYISHDKFAKLSSFEVFPGDVLVTTRGTIGKSIILPENAERGILHPCLLRLQTNDNVLNNEFLRTLIQDSGIVKNQILKSSNATTIEVIYSGTIASVRIPVPPINEQYEINQFISNIERNFRTLIQKNIDLISQLTEYHKTLISEAVTGKIDLRESV